MSLKSGTKRRCVKPRKGASIVEMALILPLVMLMGIGLCVAELGVFRYHQVASLAHESARWAAVRGKNFARRSKKPIATTQDIMDNVIRPRAKGLDLNKLTPVLEWDENFASVKVTISYQWTPEAFFAPKTLTCTATSLSSY